MQNTSPTKKELPWKEVEQLIVEEMEWLDRSVQTFFKEAQDTAGKPICKPCTLRKIALLIVYGDVEASEIVRDSHLKDFWLSLPRNHSGRKEIHHGGDWHQNTMMKIENHFLALGFDVVREPNLLSGRADLGVYKEGAPPLFIEVGTTTLFKLAVNLSGMPDFVYLIVPEDEKLIEFKKVKNLT